MGLSTDVRGSAFAGGSASARGSAGARGIQANVDAFAEARNLGLADDHAYSFSHDADGMVDSFDAISRSARNLRRAPGRAGKLRAKDRLLEEVRRERLNESRLEP